MLWEQIETAKGPAWFVKKSARLRQWPRDVADLRAAREGNSREHGIRAYELPERGRTLLLHHRDPGSGGEHRVVGDQDPARDVVVRLDPDRVAMLVDEKIAVERDVALALEQRLVPVLVEEVAIDRVVVFGAGAFEREMPNQYVGARRLGRSGVGLREDVVADARGCGSPRSASRRCSPCCVPLVR